ncbi:Aste57867_1562 [Aphanomyces stellatus]|uniref:Aste57867_1562 protein n=1 Tax=Aphanomyces stellatus TaxID=120398 RepID=A0A485K8Y5_9STRA|nr:hypothetical protein As57867_001561 [Aphanomyces stellatus]VFT78775.1 Aste57867_1562 [Aphanomyces stellatus]
MRVDQGMPPLTTTEETIALLHLAFPTFVNILSFFALSMVEMIVAGHLGTSEMTAVAFSQIVFDLSIVVFTQGFNRGLSSVGSQAFGAKNMVLLGRYAQVGCIGITVVTAPLALLWWFVGDILGGLGIATSPDTIILAKQYSHLCVLWIWPRLMFNYVSVYFNTQQIVVPTAIISLVFASLHVGVNFVLVFGMPSCGWHGFGFLGLPLAMAFTQYTRLIVYLVYMMGFKQYHRASWMWTLDCLDWKYLRGQVVVGMPLALGTLFENLQLQAMAFMAATQGEVSLDGHNAMLGLLFVLNSPIYGLSTAGILRIGMYLGANHPIQAKRVGLILRLSVFVIALVTTTVLVLCRGIVGHLYSIDPAVWASMTQICTLSAAGYLVLSFFYSSMAILTGQARAPPILGTFPSLVIVVVPDLVAVAFFTGAWLTGVPTAYMLGLRWHLGLLGIWIGMALGYVVTALITNGAVATSEWDEEAARAVERSKAKQVETERPTEATRLV